MKYSHFGWTSHCVNISYDPIKLSADGKITTSKSKAFKTARGHLQSSSMFQMIWKQNKEKRLQILLFFFSLLAVKAVKSLTNLTIGVFEVCLSVCQEELASVSGLRLRGWSPAAGTGKQQSLLSLQQLSARETKTRFTQHGNAKTKEPFRAPTPKEFPWGLEFCQLTHKHSQGKVKDISRQQPGASQSARHKAKWNVRTHTHTREYPHWHPIHTHFTDYYEHFCTHTEISLLPIHTEDSMPANTPFWPVERLQVGPVVCVCVWERGQRSKLCVMSCWGANLPLIHL